MTPIIFVCRGARAARSSQTPLQPRVACSLRVPQQATWGGQTRRGWWLGAGIGIKKCRCAPSSGIDIRIVVEVCLCPRRFGFGESVSVVLVLAAVHEGTDALEPTTREFV